MDLSEQWLAPGLALPRGGRVDRRSSRAADWQIFGVTDGGSVLAAQLVAVERWAGLELLPFELWSSVEGLSDVLLLQVERGYRLEPVAAWLRPADKAEATAFAKALRRSRIQAPGADFRGAVYSEKHACLLPDGSDGSALDDGLLLGRWISGGVGVHVSALARLSELHGGLSPVDLAHVAGTAGIPGAKVPALVEAGPAAGGGPRLIRVPDPSVRPFTLVGREQLTSFLREHVLDVLYDLDRYRALGVGFPGAVALCGPPGCGKTFGVEQLVRHLGWPCFEIGSASVASPYIHETGRKIAEVFDAAAAAAPAVIVIDEMEAWLADRAQSIGAGLHHVEEVGEFLRRIPKARDDAVLVFGMTNKLDLVDPAMLRRGRFDHVLELDLPSAAEVDALLTYLLEGKPCGPGLDRGALARSLAGRPLADIAFVVREAARLSARAQAERIEAAMFGAALAALPPRAVGGTSAAMGFQVG